jgi:alanine racemase
MVQMDTEITDRKASLLPSCNRVEISTSALRHNFRLCRKRAGGAGIMPMVKADGYGHGMIECARIFAAEGAAAFGVAEAREGVLLRQAGVEQPVFVLVGTVPEIIPDLLRHRLTPVVVDGEILPDLARQAVELGMTVGLHLKVDAGMGRQGILPGEVPGLVRRIRETPGLSLEGIMAHFPMADALESPNTLAVFERFQGMVREVADELPVGCCLHIANSGGIFHFNRTCLHMSRPGIALYGCYPEGEPHRPLGGHDALLPAMRFVTRVVQVREVPAGTGLGYGHTFTTSRKTVLAVLPVGYEDGYLRVLSNRAKVLVRGQRARVVGRVSMNLTLVDVTDIRGDVRRGDEVVLLGRQGDESIGADEIASWMETISYEVLCLFGNLNDRCYVD